MRHPTFYAAVFAIIRDTEGKILFQKRENTGFRDGQYQLPSGHIEPMESVKTALMRELEEEIGITTGEEDIEIVHVAHALSIDRTYFNIYANIREYRGIIENREIDKCSHLDFFDFESVKGRREFHYEIETLEKIFSGESFSQKILQ